MDEFPGNSQNAQPEEEPLVVKRVVNKKVEQVDKIEVKKVEKVVAGGVVRRKKPLGKRFAETFFGGTAKGVVTYVVFEVLLPAAKDTVADAVSQGIERMLFGESRSTSRRTGSRVGTSAGHVSYNRYSTTTSSSTPPWHKERREEPRTVGNRARAAHDFDEIILDTRVEAEEVIERLCDLVDQYDEATVANLYELVGVDTSYTDNRWGWTNMRKADVIRVRNGYLLDLPKPEPLRE